jgi:hypothetical protein
MGSSSGGGGIQVEINTNPFDPNPESAHRGRTKIVDSNSWSDFGEGVSNFVDEAAEWIANPNKKQEKEKNKQKKTQAEAHNEAVWARTIANMRAYQEYQRQLQIRQALIDRQRQQLVSSGQVNPLFTPGSLSGKRKAKAPFSTPPITGVRLG